MGQGKKSLEDEGNTVVLVELLGHGNDHTPVSEITFDKYVKQVTDAIDDLHTPVILVGHSLGGAIVTQAASKMPQKISKLIYVAGFIPKNGSSVFDYSAMGSGTLIPSALEFSADGSTVTIANPTVNIPEIFCKDGSVEDNNLLVSKLRPDPVAAAGTPLSYNIDAYNWISEKYYIYIQPRTRQSVTLFRNKWCRKQISKTLLKLSRDIVHLFQNRQSWFQLSIK